MLPSPSVHAYQARRLEYELDVSHDAFARALESLVPPMSSSVLEGLRGRSAEEAKTVLGALVGPVEFVLFQKLDHGALMTAFTGRPTRATTYVFGNALIAVQMTKHASRVGLYVPLRLFVQEIAPERILLTYDLPSATLGQFGSGDVDAVAHELDAKVVRLEIGRAHV